MKPTGQTTLSSTHDNETLAEAIRRYEESKAKCDPILINQGRLEGGLDEPKIQND